MKQLLILFCFFGKLFGNDETLESCKPWPSNVRSLRECCEIPQLSSAYIQDACTKQCVSMEDDDKDCPINCYLNETMLIKNGTIDKTVAKKIFNWNDNIYGDLYEWRKVVAEGLDKCEYVASDSVTQSLVKFYDCVSDYLAENCVKFRYGPECEETEKLFNKCEFVNCTEWPSKYNPYYYSPGLCCYDPQPISESVNDKCRAECSQKEFFIRSQMDCEEKCKVDALFTTDDKIDFELVKKFLIESSNGNEIWEKPITSAVEKCEKVVAGLEKEKQNRTTIVDHLKQCFEWELSEGCVQPQTHRICNKMRSFMSHCPDTKPPE